MKKLINSQSVLGKLGIALTFVLPTIGFAEAYSTAITPQAQSNPALEERIGVLRGSEELMGDLVNWQATKDKNGQHAKAQEAIRKRTKDETTAEEARLDKINRTMKTINMSGLDQAVQAMSSMFGNIKRKECKQPLDFSNMFRMSAGMKDFVGQLTSNFSKQNKEAQEDIQEKAARLAAEENARQERLLQDNPAEAQYKKETAELEAAAKDPKKLLAYMKKQAADANSNATQALKQNIRLTNKLLNSPNGLVNLLAAIQKDEQLFTEFGTQMMNAVSGTFTSILGEGKKQVDALAQACDANLNSVKQAKAQLDPVVDKFNDQEKKRRNKNLLARAVKADCSVKPDLEQVRTAVAGAETGMRNAIANNDPAAFVQAFAQGPQLMQDALNQVIAKPATELGQACDSSGTWLDFFKKDPNTQGLKQAAETGNMASAVEQVDPNAGAQQQPQALRNPVQPTFASPGLK